MFEFYAHTQSGVPIQVGHLNLNYTISTVGASIDLKTDDGFQSSISISNYRAFSDEPVSCASRKRTSTTKLAFGQKFAARALHTAGCNRLKCAVKAVTVF